MSMSAIAKPSAKGLRSARIAPFSAISAWPEKTMSCVLSPRPAFA